MHRTYFDEKSVRSRLFFLSSFFYLSGATHHLAFDDLSHQPQHLTRFGVTMSLEFGINQFVSNCDLEPASVRGNQGQVPDIVLELFQQFRCQAHGPVGVMSYSAVNDFDVYH